MSELPAATAHPHPSETARLDVWLWAARFFKTRSLAKQAIEAGHVRYEGERAKVAKAVQVGAAVRIRQGFDEIEVSVLALSEVRGPAPVARLLYAETGESRARREREADLRRAAGAQHPDRPTPRQRRLIHKFKRELGFDKD